MPTLGLSQPNAVTPISDVVHGCFELTVFDRDLVDHRYFQRLHFILQNSVNYVSFPANKNSRFPHSLGVAHFSSQMLVKALSNSDSKCLRRFLDVAANFILRIEERVSSSNPVGLVSTGSTSQIDDHVEAHGQTIIGKSGFLHVPISPNGSTRLELDRPCGTGKKKLPAGFVVDTLWQSIRLYGLVHDIGHLPMSHAFEMAIGNLPEAVKSMGGDKKLIADARRLSIARRDDFTGLDSKPSNYYKGFAKLLGVTQSKIKNVSAGKALHETRGISLYNIFISNFSRPSAGFNTSSNDKIDKYGLLIHHLTLCIILSPALSPSQIDKKQKRSQVKAHKHSFLYALRSLVDGEVEGDRIDYTIRDSYEAGLKAGDFDSRKISDFSILVADNDPNVFSFGFFHRALGSVEQFFEARYQCYKYQIFHRTTVRSNKCVEELIAQVIAFSFVYPDSSIADIAERYGYIKRSNGAVSDLLPVVLEFIEKIDDATLRSLVFEVKETLSSQPTQDALSARDDGSFEAAHAILCLADVVIFRDFSKICTLFKDTSLKKLIADATESTPPEEKVKELAIHLLRFGDEFVAKLRKAVWARSMNELGKPILVFSATTGAKVYDAGIDATTGKLLENRAFEDEVWIVDGEGQRHRIASRSPSLRDMAKRKEDDRRRYIYAVGEDLKTPDSKELEIVKEEALDILGAAFRGL